MFKINIATKDGKSFKIEAEAEALIGKKIGDTVSGKDITPELASYEFEISGASDKSGFASMKDVEGENLKRVLLTYGKGMKKRPRREGKRKQLCKKPKGLRLRKTVCGNTISDRVVQINLKIIKEGSKKLSEIFADQNKAPETEAPAEQSAPTESAKAETPAEKTAEEKTENPKEEKKVEVKKEKVKPVEKKE